MIGFILLCLPAIAASADQVRLKTGKVIKGDIIDRSFDVLRLKRGKDVMKVKLRYVDVLIIESEDGTQKKYAVDQLDQIPGLKSSPDQSSGRGGGIDNSTKTAKQIFENSADAIVVLLTYFEEWAGQGSGFFVHSSGVIVTNFHVIGGAEKIAVKLRSGEQYEVQGVVDFDISRDLCLLKIERDASEPLFPTLPLGSNTRPPDYLRREDF